MFAFMSKYHALSGRAEGRIKMFFFRIELFKFMLRRGFCSEQDPYIKDGRIRIRLERPDSNFLLNQY